LSRRRCFSGLFRFSGASPLEIVDTEGLDPSRETWELEGRAPLTGPVDAGMQLVAERLSVNHLPLRVGAATAMPGAFLLRSA
jgi:hypothetical protein